MTNIIHTTAPVVRIETPILVRWGTETSEFGTRGRIQVERPTILWIRRTESTIEFSHGGTNLMYGSTYCDTLYGNSIQSAFSHFMDAVDEYDVTPRSSLRIEGVTKVIETPVIKSDERPYGKQSKAYRTLEDVWWVVDNSQELADIMQITGYNELHDRSLPRVKDIEITRIMPFSSAFTEVKNRSLYQETIKQLQAEAIDLDPPQHRGDRLRLA